MTGGDKVYIKVSAIMAVQSYRGGCQMLLACFFCVFFFFRDTYALEFEEPLSTSSWGADGGIGKFVQIATLEHLKTKDQHTPALCDASHQMTRVNTRRQWRISLVFCFQFPSARRR